jgi:coenzyme Q-binding protein COQ10
MPTHAERRVVPFTPEQLFDLVADVGQYPSFVTLDRPRRVTVKYENGPFRYLNNQWDFSPHGTGTEVAFFVDFEFRSRILRAAIGVVFNEAVRRMVNAFLKRARDVYGPPPTG